MRSPVIIDQGFGIHTIDTGFQRPGMVAAHVMAHHGRAALVDVGVAPGAETLFRALDHLGIALEAIEIVLVTHVHLDHAGAAGVLMQRLPNAKLVVHPRGAPHMRDPSKLIAGATAVYGVEQMRAAFGEILPVAPERIVEADDGFTLELGERRLLFLDSPGHAKHHYCVYDSLSRGIFTGDTFGLSYREFDTQAGPWIFPTTTPVQFDPEALHQSIERLLDLGPERMYLTHFGCVERPRPLADALHRQIDDLAALAVSREQQPAGEPRVTALRRDVQDLVLRSVAEHGCDLPQKRVLELMEIDIELNAQGLETWLQYRARQRTAALDRR